jgi:hypothetical protein
MWFAILRGIKPIIILMPEIVMFKPISLFFFSVIILFTVHWLGAMEAKLGNQSRDLRTVTSTPRGDAKLPARAARRRAVVAVLDSAFARELIDLIMQYDSAFRGSCVNTSTPLRRKRR